MRAPWTARRSNQSILKEISPGISLEGMMLPPTPPPARPSSPSVHQSQAVMCLMPSGRLIGYGPHLAWRGEPPGCSRVAAGALDLRRGPQGPTLVASGKASPKNTQDWSPLGWTGWISLQSKGLARVFSNFTVQKHQFFCA